MSRVSGIPVCLDACSFPLAPATAAMYQNTKILPHVLPMYVHVISGFCAWVGNRVNTVETLDRLLTYDYDTYQMKITIEFEVAFETQLRAPWGSEVPFWSHSLLLFYLATNDMGVPSSDPLLRGVSGFTGISIMTQECGGRSRRVNAESKCGRILHENYSEVLRVSLFFPGRTRLQLQDGPTANEAPRPPMNGGTGQPRAWDRRFMVLSIVEEYLENPRLCAQFTALPPVVIK